MARFLIILVLGGCVGLFIYFCQSHAETKRKIKETEKQVSSIAAMLDNRIDDNGAYIRVSELEEVDAWKTQIIVGYRGDGLRPNIEHVYVCSAGPDKEYGTEDDITAIRRNVIPANL